MSMRNISFATLLLGLLLAACKPVGPENPKDNPLSEASEEGHPGYHDQWLAMKAGPDGTFPEGVWGRVADRIRAGNSSLKTQSTFLTNITEIGPDNVGGRTRALIQDILNNNRWLAGGISGGIWESTDAGANWHAVDDAAPQFSVMSLAQDPNLPLEIYYCTGEPRGNSAGVVGAGVFKSTDGGQTFAQLPSTNNSTFDEAWKVAIDPTTPGRVFVATHDDGLHVSENGGTTFSPVLITGNPSDVTDVEIFPDGSVMAGIRSEGVFYSPDGSAGNYSELSGNLPTTNFLRVELAYCDSVPSTIYVQYEDDGGSDLLDIYKSTDGGNNWNAVTNPNITPGVSYLFPWYAFLLSVKPDNPNIVLSGSARMGYSLDGGSTWTQAHNSHSDYHIGVWDRTNSERVWIGNDGGIHTYTTLTLNNFATAKNTDYRVTQFYTGAYFPQANDIMGGTQDNGTQCSRSFSSSFDRINGSDGGYCAVNQQDPNVSFVSTQNGGIRRAINSQSTFPTYTSALNQLDGDGNGSVDDGAWFINPFEINLLEGNQLYFPTLKRIWRTVDGGFNWTPITNNLVNGSDNPFFVALSNELEPTAYVGGEKAMFYRIDDAKNSTPGTETLLNGSVPISITNDFISCIAVHPSDPGTLYVTFSTVNANPRIWKVTNGLTNSPTWTSVSGDLPSELSVNWIAFHPDAPDSILLAGTDFGLFVSEDGGAHWVRETSIPAVVVTQVRIRPSDQRAFIFTHGRGVFYADLPLITEISPPNPQAESIQVFPNPATGQFKVVSAQSASYRYFDAQGRQIEAGNLGAGESRSFQRGNLTAGVYFLQFEMGEKVITKRVVWQ